MPHERMVNTDRADANWKVRSAQRFEQIAAYGLTRFCAKPAHVARSVVTLQRGQIDERDRAEQPGGLPLLLHSATGWNRRRAPLDCAPVHAHVAHPVELEWNARVSVVMRFRAPACF